MRLINLTELEYKNYSQIHSKRNYKQTVAYANMMRKNGYNTHFLGLIDEDNNVICATLILERSIYKKYKIGYAPFGFLIDFDNEVLLKTFTDKLKAYLKDLNYVFLKLNPNFAYRVFDKNNLVIKCYPNIMDSMKKLGYVHLGFKDSMERYDAILHYNNDVFNSFNRNTKRKINDNKLMGLTYYQENDVEKFYSLILKKQSKNIDYFRDYMNYFNDLNCKFEIYFAKIDPSVYLNNYQRLLDEEKLNNDELSIKIRDMNVKKTKKLLDAKIRSDKLINKYKQEIIKASSIYSSYPSGVIVSSVAIIRNDNTVYFIEEGYEEKLRSIHSLTSLKWEIIKKYRDIGYCNFNLGKIPNRKSKYNGIYLSKIGFNPKIYEYPGEFDLIINKYGYNVLRKLKK